MSFSIDWRLAVGSSGLCIHWPEPRTCSGLSWDPQSDLENLEQEVAFGESLGHFGDSLGRHMEWKADEVDLLLWLVWKGLTAVLRREPEDFPL